MHPLWRAPADIASGSGVMVRSPLRGLWIGLDDGTGRVVVLVWQDLDRSLGIRERVQVGARLRAVGEVAEYRGQLEVVPEIVADVTILATAPQQATVRSIGGLSVTDLGQVVRVEGVLQTIRAFSAGQKGVLDDGTGRVVLLLWQDVWQDLVNAAEIVPGAVLRVDGEVAEYGGELEIVPLAAAGLAVAGRAELPARPVAIGQIATEDAGQRVEVAGQVDRVWTFAQGQKATLADETGEITLTLWQEVHDELEARQALVPGASVVARGLVAEYRGQLEIVPDSAADLEVTAPDTTPTATVAVAAATPGTTPSATPEPTPATATRQPTIPPTTVPTATPPPRSIGSLSTEDVGARVTLARAGIAGVTYFSLGVKYTLTDATGSVTLLIWQEVLETLTGRLDLFPGSQVRVSGEIDEYGGELEIVPRRPGDVQVVARGERPAVEERALGSITASDEGRIFAVTGTVTRAESRGWLKLWLNDGTGELLLFLPERLVPFLPAGLGPGAHLAASGEVDVYGGVVEIIPLAGADVVRR